MKLLTFEHDNKESIGILINDTKIMPLKNLNINYKSMHELICNITESEMQKLKDKNLIETNSKNLISIEDVKKAAPIPEPAQDIICLGINYMAHAEESARYKKEAFEIGRASCRERV